MIAWMFWSWSLVDIFLYGLRGIRNPESLPFWVTDEEIVLFDDRGWYLTPTNYLSDSPDSF